MSDLLSNIDKQALREVAEKATPGPWLWINTGSYFSFLVPQSNQDPHNCIIDDGSSWGEYGETINPESPDGVFIAAANPTALLALLDELEAEQRISSTWRKTAESNREKLEAAEKRIAELEAESSIEAKRLLSRRAAMLQGAENAESRCTIQPAPALDSSPKNDEFRCGNSPVIPDWQAKAEKMAELHGMSFVVFRNGDEPQCADPSKVVISFTDEGLGYGPKAPQQEVK